MYGRRCVVLESGGSLIALARSTASSRLHLQLSMVARSDAPDQPGREPACSAPTRIRTWGLLLRRETLYPAELSGLGVIEAELRPPHRALGSTPSPGRRRTCRRT